MDRIKKDTPLGTVLSYIKKSRYLILRGYRSEATIRDIFWKSILTHTIVDPTTINEASLIKKFLHTFINVETSIKALDVYFDGMSRQFWEINKSEIDDFFLDQTAAFSKILIEVIGHMQKLSIAYKDANNISFNLDGIQSEGKRSGQSVSEIILFNYPSKLTVNNESETEILLNNGIKDDEIKRIHDKTMKACMAHLTSLIYYKYFLPFSNSPHLPFLKTK